jgi:glycosyltransferase involved in cell wall biosynthesis
VLQRLLQLGPDVVFAPATPFPEGMAAIRYRQIAGKRVFIMDDSWEGTDTRGRLIKAVKRQIHLCVDGAFLPTADYADYFTALGIPRDRQIFGVDVVDNDFYARPPELPAAGAAPSRRSFLFVGRDLPRKGLNLLLAAYRSYRARASDPWDLVIVGPGSESGAACEGVLRLGPRVGRELCEAYWLASVLVVPSITDQWGLVVNEGMAASLPVIASRGVGAARSLVTPGRTGWLFPIGDEHALFSLLCEVAALPADTLRETGQRAATRVREICSLDGFVSAIAQAIEIPRREESNLISRMACQVWRGHVRQY